jgi:membrane protein required for colicin V production
MIVDIIVLAVLLVSAAIAFLRGFIREVLTIAGVVGGIAAAYAGGPILGVHMDRWLGIVEGEEPKRLFDILPYTILSDILSYGIIFIVVVIVLSVLSHIIAESARAVGLGPIDRTLGVLFGLARGLILLGLLYLPVHLFTDVETKTRWFEGSRTHVYVEQTSQAMAAMIPDEAMKKIEEDKKKFDEGNATRETLQEKGLLPGGQPREGEPQQQLDQPQEGVGGYNEEFRQKMDQLFDQKTNNQGQQP